jgi:hypothetical protein
MIVQRMIRAARLDVDLYEEVEHDASLTTEAGTVVALVAAAEAAGTAIATWREQGPGMAAVAFVLTLVFAMIGWIVWSYITYFVGTSLFKGTATPGELMRTIGYAQSPRLIGLLRAIPVVGPLFALVAFVWTLVTGVVAVRQALDFSTGPAIVTVLIGGLVSWCLSCSVMAVVYSGTAILGSVIR